MQHIIKECSLRRVQKKYYVFPRNSHRKYEWENCKRTKLLHRNNDHGSQYMRVTSSFIVVITASMCVCPFLCVRQVFIVIVHDRGTPEHMFQ